MTSLTPGQLIELIALVDDNNQFNDEEDAFNYWQEVSDALKADYRKWFETF
jgi:hypothetical protein